MTGTGCWAVCQLRSSSSILHSLEHDELREIFNDISSSSEDEDERDHHDDEDLNIMDTEEDLERQLQDKPNESDGQQQENEGSNQIGESGGNAAESLGCRAAQPVLQVSAHSFAVMGIQKQIDNLKSKLQETQDRRKRQEDLIMKVENLALKVRGPPGSLLSHLFNGLIRAVS